MADQDLTCKDCGAVFAFTEGEQQFFAERQLSAPQRCKECRKQRKTVRASGQRWPATCAQCQAACEVPFEPKPNGRPVLCDNCFKASRSMRQAA